MTTTASVLALLAAFVAGCAGSDNAFTPDPDAGGPGDAQAVDAGADHSACDPTLTYANFGMAFLDTYCGRCHGFTQQNAQLAGAAISGAAGTGSFMPPAEPRPTAAERQKLVAWIACGAP